jgi:hypothetical protein
MKKTHLALALAIAFPLSFAVSAAAQTTPSQTGAINLFPAVDGA